MQTSIISQKVACSLLALTVLALASCGGPEPSEKTNNKSNVAISEKEAVNLATQEFLKIKFMREGETLKDYQVNVTENKEEWFITFAREIHAPGIECEIIINKQTGELRHGISK